MARKKLWLLCGLPGSGKSSWLRRHARGAVIVCPDRIRKDILGHQFHQAAEQLVWWFAESMARLILSQGKDVAVDATNLFPFLREKWGRMAGEYGADMELVYMDVSPVECWRRNQHRPKADRVPREAFDRMVAAFCPPEHNGSHRGQATSDGFRFRRVR